jgi:hypothetical protein
MDSLDSPWPGLGGSHHLPPYSILCIAPLHSHPNGFYSQDSQGGVLKLSRFGLSGLWEFITPSSDLGLRWGLKKTCSFPQDLSNSVSHLIYTHWDRVDSRLFVVGSQIASLTPGSSFDHNSCCICPNGSCEASFYIYISRLFQRYKEHLKARCFDLCTRALKLRESQRTPSSHFLGVWVSSSHLPQSGVATCDVKREVIFMWHLCSWPLFLVCYEKGDYSLLMVFVMWWRTPLGCIFVVWLFFLLELWWQYVK